MNIEYVYNSKTQQLPLQEIVDDTIVINLTSQYYIDQEAKKLEIAQKSFNDQMVNEQAKAFKKFLSG